MATQNLPMCAQKITLGLFALLLTIVTAAPLQSAEAQSSASEPSKQDKYVHYSLYYENYKNEDYRAALSDLRWMLEHAPAFPNNTKKNFERAVDVYAGIGMAAEDPEVQQAYLDSAFTMLDTAPERLQELGMEVDPYKWTMKKGRFVQQYGEQMPAVKEKPEEYYHRAFELAPSKMQAYYIDRILKNYMERQEQSEALNFIEQCETSVGDNQEIMQVVNRYRQQIFGRNPQARIEFLEKTLAENPDDAQVMGDLFELYLNQGQRSKASELSAQLLQTSPSLDVYRKIAEMRLDDGRAQEAFKLYQKAESEADAPLTAQDHFNMGEAQEQMGNFAQARRHYRKAIELDAGFGQAYVAIGDLYVQAVSDCGGSKMSRGDKAVYWLAVDMYRRAKSVDETLASTANSKINTYRQYFPSSDDIFFRDDMEMGRSFRIDYGCYSWINEVTTVRKAS